MALGQENVMDLGPCSQSSILDALPWLRQVSQCQGGQHLPGQSCPHPCVPKELSSDLVLKVLLWSGKLTFPVLFLPTSSLLCPHLWHRIGPRRTLLSPPKRCRSQQDWCWDTTVLTLPWRGWKGSTNCYVAPQVSSVSISTTGVAFHPRVSFAPKASQHLADNYWRCSVSQDSYSSNLGSCCT